MIIMGQQKAVLVSIWWYWVSMGRYWLVLWVLGQYNLVLLGIEWYWVSIGLLCLYILKKWRFSRMSPQRDNKQTTNKEIQSYSANGPWKAEMSNINFYSVDVEVIVAGKTSALIVQLSKVCKLKNQTMLLMLLLLFGFHAERIFQRLVGIN